METTNTTPTNLTELLEAIRAGRYSESAMAELPTFGGEEPRNTLGVWSWDATRLLVGAGSSELRIVAREDYRG